MKKPAAVDLPVIDQLATGIDVGSEKMFVSIGGKSPETFGTTTGELHRLANYLIGSGARTVALEATGIYWLCLYEVLEKAGMEIYVVNGRHVKNLPGRKTDVSDSQWLATMHSRGLLRSGFVPSFDIRRLQDYVRVRQDHVGQAAAQVQHMQKAFERMNIKIYKVISKLNGVSGMNMVRAIVEGERDPENLANLCSPLILKKKKKALLEALQGNFRSEHTFALRQALNTWDFYQQLIQECDVEIGRVLEELAAQQTKSDSGSNPHAVNSAPETGPSKPKPVILMQKKSIGTPKIVGLHSLLFHISGGKEVTAIPGIADQTWLQLISELGIDLACFKTVKQFTAWLGLAPGNAQSGKRSRAVRRSPNRAGRQFCMVAQSLANSVDKALGAFYRRIKARRGAPIAIKALARKMAEMYWRIMVHGMEYVEEGVEAYNKKAADSDIRLAKRLLAKHKLVAVPMGSTPT